MANTARRLTPEERAKVLEVMRDPQHVDCTDREISDILATHHGITITAGSIGATYRPKLNGLHQKNGNGKPARPAAEKPTREPRAAAPASTPDSEIEVLPYQVYHLEDGAVQLNVDIATTPRRALAIIAAVNAALLGG